MPGVPPGGDGGRDVADVARWALWAREGMVFCALTVGLAIRVVSRRHKRFCKAR